MRPFEDEVLREQLAHASPVPRLNAAPELRNDLSSVQGWRRSGRSHHLRRHFAHHEGNGAEDEEDDAAE